MKATVTSYLYLQALLVGSLQASVATLPNQLLGGQTTYSLHDYENLYDSSGNLVTSRVAQAGDTLQGVFVISTATNQYGTAAYAPGIAGAVEFTGVFSEAVAGFDSAGNYKLVPDTTATVGAKAISGAQFQALYGNGTNNAMWAFYYNNSDAMPVGTTGNGLSGLSIMQATALAKSGTLWATFGGNGSWGGIGGYYSAGQQTQVGVGTFAASLGFISNLTGIGGPAFFPLTQAPTGLNSDPTLSSIANDLIMASTTMPSNANLTGTPYTVFGVDHQQLDCVSVWSAAASGNWTDASKWLLGVPNGAGVEAVLNTPTSAAVTVTVNAPQTLGTLLLGNSTGGTAGYTLAGSGGSTLTLSNSVAGAAIAVSGGSHAVNVPVILANNLTVSGSGILLFGSSGGIAQSGTGSRSLTLNVSGGTLILSGSDSYGGGTIVAAGRLIVTNRDALASGTSLTIGASASSIFTLHTEIVPETNAPAAVPEPATIALLGAGAVGWIALGGNWRKRLLRRGGKRVNRGKEVETVYDAGNEQKQF